MRTIHESKIPCARCGTTRRWPNGECMGCDGAAALRALPPLSCRSCGRELGTNPNCGECRDEKAEA